MLHKLVAVLNYGQNPRCGSTARNTDPMSIESSIENINTSCLRTTLTRTRPSARAAMASASCLASSSPSRLDSPTSARVAAHSPLASAARDDAALANSSSWACFLLASSAESCRDGGGIKSGRERVDQTTSSFCGRPGKVVASGSRGALDKSSRYTSKIVGENKASSNVGQWRVGHNSVPKGGHERWNMTDNAPTSGVALVPRDVNEAMRDSSAGLNNHSAKGVARAHEPSGRRFAHTTTATVARETPG